MPPRLRKERIEESKEEEGIEGERKQDGRERTSNGISGAVF